jgi:hypothetical protein
MLVIGLPHARSSHAFPHVHETIIALFLSIELQTS